MYLFVCMTVSGVAGAVVFVLTNSKEPSQPKKKQQKGKKQILIGPRVWKLAREIISRLVLTLSGFL
jgi:hypothetical protein